MSSGAPGQLRPAAHVITAEDEAIAVARDFAAKIAPGAAERDRTRAVPYGELAELGQTGLLGISVPAGYGGLGASAQTIAEVFRILAVADPAIAQVPQNHFFTVRILLENGTPGQLAFFLGEVLAGKRFGNALSERGTKHVGDLKTLLSVSADSSAHVLNGRKYYATGALTAQWIPVYALDAEQRVVTAFVPRDAPGVELLNDWTAMGQRATASGTAIFTDVGVPAEHVVHHWRTFERPQVFGAFGQVIHNAIDVGIAEAALLDAAEFVRTRTRPYFEAARAGQDRASEDPVTLVRFGQLSARLHAAQLLLRDAAEKIDAADALPAVTQEAAAAASLAVAESKAFGGEVAVEIANELFALSGTSATDEGLGLDRHWRNARTHTLHDPAAWKYRHAGNYLVNGIRPPNHDLI